MVVGRPLRITSLSWFLHSTMRTMSFRPQLPSLLPSLAQPTKPLTLQGLILPVFRCAQRLERSHPWCVQKLDHQCQAGREWLRQIPNIRNNIFLKKMSNASPMFSTLQKTKNHLKKIHLYLFQVPKGSKPSKVICKIIQKTTKNHSKCLKISKRLIQNFSNLRCTQRNVAYVPEVEAEAGEPGGDCPDFLLNFTSPTSTRTPKGMLFGWFYVTKNLQKTFLWRFWYGFSCFFSTVLVVLFMFLRRS